MSGLSTGSERRRRRRRWFAAGIAAATAVFVLDAATAEKVVTLIALFAVPPFITAVGATRGQTLAVALFSIALTVPAGLIDGIFGDFEHVVKTGVVAVAALAAVRVAAVRDRAELGNALDYAVASALAESPTLSEATPRLLEGIGDLIGWQAGALWEIAPGGTTLRCIATWESPNRQSGSSTTSGARASSCPAWAFPESFGRAASRNGSTRSGHDERLPRGQSAAGRGPPERARVPDRGHAGRARSGRVLHHREATSRPRPDGDHGASRPLRSASRSSAAAARRPFARARRFAARCSNPRSTA